MSTATIVNTVSVLGKSVRSERAVTADGTVLKDPSLAAAKTGTLTTRTDNNTGTVTMTAGHGFATSDRCDLYWSGGARYGMTVTVTVNSVVFDGGGGDNLPIATTAVTAMKAQLETFPVTAADLQALFVVCASPAWAVFLESDNTLVKAVYVGGSTDGFSYDVDDPNVPATPFGADVAKVWLSHGSSAGAKQVSAVALVN